jgi:epoxyqueuosine reductase
VVTALQIPDVAELIELGRSAGLDAVGVCTAEPFADVRRTLESRKAAGLHGDMAFTYRNPSRSTDPSATLPGAAALVVGAIGYRRGEPPAPESAGPVARVAAYAWEDHYARLRGALEPVAERLRSHGWRTRTAVDDNALVDRAAAVRAGLAWWGKSANVLLPGRGSWFVLGSVITDAPLVTAAPPAQPDGCGPCRRCLDGCPTGAIVAPGVVDARRCLSWLLQAPGAFPREHRAALGGRLYGCDDCQEVCPPNVRDDRRGLADPGGDAQVWVAVLDVLAASDDELLARHGRWYIPRRDPRFVRRNALVVLGNTGERTDGAVIATLQRYLADPDPMLRAHAVWAAGRIGAHGLLDAVRDDPDGDVQDELRAAIRSAG